MELERWTDFSQTIPNKREEDVVLASSMGTMGGTQLKRTAFAIVECDGLSRMEVVSQQLRILPERNALLCQ